MFWGYSMFEKFIKECESKLSEKFEYIDDVAYYNQTKVLKALEAEKEKGD